MVDLDEVLPRIPGYVLPERISALVDTHIQKTRKWERSVYHLEYMAHRDNLVYVYVHHQDESRLAGGNTLGSVLDFYVGVDEQSGEIRKEGQLQ